MARPITLFTGQWADLPLDDAGGARRRRGASTASSSRAGATTSRSPRAGRARLRRRAGASCSSATASACWAIGNHLVGQAVCDPIDARHQGVLPPEVWGDGDPEGVRTRAAERMKDTARAAAAARRRRSSPASPARRSGTMLYSFPPNDFGADRARLRGVRRALGADHRRLRRRGRALRARGPPDRDRLRLRDHAQGAGRDRPTATGFGINFDPSHFEPQFLDPAAVRRPSSPTASTTSTSRTRSVMLDGRALDPRLAPRLRRGRAAAGTSSRPGHGDVDFEALFRALNRIGYDGPAVGRVGGLGHGPRLGRAGRARVRAPDRLRALVGGLRRGVREGGLNVEVGFDTQGDAARRRRRRRRIGVGMLGYAFMGKAHANAYRTLAYMTWPPPLVPELVAIAGPQRGGGGRGRAPLRLRRPRHRLARARRRRRASACSTTRARTTSTPSRRSPPPRRAST